MTDMPAIDISGWEIPGYEAFRLKPRSGPYAVCIPVINEGDRIARQLMRMRDARIFDHADIVVCDGGSGDGSLEAGRLRDAGVTELLVKRGPGRLSAQLRMGYSHALAAGYEGVITIDGNDKDGVEAIPAFVRALSEGWDMVQGSRYIEGGRAVNTPLVRELAVKLIHIPFVSWLAGFPYTDTTNGFRAYSRRLLLDPRVAPFRNVFDSYELLAYLSVKAPRLGYRVRELPVCREYPAAGGVPTKISSFRGNLKLLKILLDLALGRCDVPEVARDGR